MKHEKSSFTGVAGRRIYRQSWQPDGSLVGTVVLVHGYGEHSGRYQHVAAKLVDAGWGVFTLDHRGHGRSQGPRADVENLDWLLADVDYMVDEAMAADGGRKPVLLGHSMGGSVAAAFALEHQERLTGLVLSGPALDVSDATPLPLRLGAQVVPIAWPGAPTIALPPEAVSRDPEVVAAYASDPLVHHGRVPARTGREILKAADRVLKRAGEITLPVLVMHGSADRLAAPKGSERFIAKVGSADQTLEIYDGLFHEIFNEPEKDQVLADLISWLDKHRPALAEA